MRLRLTLWIALIFTLVLWVTLTVFWLYQREQVNSVFVNFLTQRTSSIASQLNSKVPNVSREELDLITQEMTRAIEFELLHIQVFSVSGEPINQDDLSVKSPELLPLELAAESIDPVYIHDPDLLTRIVNIPESALLDSGMLTQLIGQNGQPYILFVATSDRFAMDGKVLLC